MNSIDETIVRLNNNLIDRNINVIIVVMIQNSFFDKS